MKTRKIILLIATILLLCIGICACANAENNSNVTTTSTYKVIAKSGLRLRSNPVNGSILTVMPYNSTINVTNSNGEWVYGNYYGTLGWCHSGYLKYVSSESNNNNNNSENLEYFGTLKITGYTPAKSENGGYDVTCKGIKLTSVIGTCVAVNTKQIPLGTKLYIEGIGYRTAMDTGVKSGVIDVLCSNKSECYSITGYRKVYIVR